MSDLNGSKIHLSANTKQILALKNEVATLIEKVSLLMELAAFLNHPALGRETGEQHQRYNEVRDLLLRQFQPWAPCVAERHSKEQCAVIADAAAAVERGESKP